MQIRSRVVAGEFKCGDRPDLYAETPTLGALIVLICIAPNHEQTLSIMHIDVSRPCFHSKASRLVLVLTSASGRYNVRRRCKIWIVQEEHARHTGRSKQLGVLMARTFQKFGMSVGAQFEESVST